MHRSVQVLVLGDKVTPVFVDSWVPLPYFDHFTDLSVVFSGKFFCDNNPHGHMTQECSSDWC